VDSFQLAPIDPFQIEKNAAERLLLEPKRASQAATKQ